jgi:hypothetical protein
MLPESFNDSLIECVKACGGSKAVGVALWPARGVEAAQRHLLACLNPDRNEKLSLDEALHVMRLARDRGCHVGMEYLCDALGYAAPQPVAPKDELTELLRQRQAAQERASAQDQRIEQLMQQMLRPRAAA